MRGVIIKRANIIHEDDRRSIVRVLNGEIGIRDIHVLYVKKGEQTMGNHWHPYREVMYILKGSAHYKLKNNITGETMETDLSEGDIMLKQGYITHSGMFTKDSIVVDGGEETYVSPNFNDVREVIYE